MHGSIIDGFGDEDLGALATVVGFDLEDLRQQVRRQPWRIHEFLSDPATAEAVLDGDVGNVAAATPMLFFGVLVHQAAEELTAADWVSEWSGPKSRLPVFDVESIVEFTRRPVRLLYLTRLLVSFVGPAKLPVPVPVDPLDLGALVDWLEAVEPADRPAMLGRLADVALYLAGVCADRIGSRPLSAIEAGKLGGSVGLESSEMLGLIDPGSISPGLDALEALGSAWYSAAAVLPSCETPAMAMDFARHIRPARRFLNHITDRYLSQSVGLTLGLAG